MESWFKNKIRKLSGNNVLQTEICLFAFEYCQKQFLFTNAIPLVISLSNGTITFSVLFYLFHLFLQFFLQKYRRWILFSVMSKRYEACLKRGNKLNYMFNRYCPFKQNISWVVNLWHGNVIVVVGFDVLCRTIFW